MDSLGKQIAMELVGCPADRLNDVVQVQAWMEAAAREAGATIINSTFHHFAPVGVSGVVVIQESHLALHTWPEYGFAALDIFTCGEQVDPWVACEYLKVALEATESTSQELARGERHHWQPRAIDQLRPMEAPVREAWFTERREHLALSLKHAGPRLFSIQSAHQKIEVFDTSGYGPALALDGAVAMTEADRAAYHEMLVHVPLQSMSEVPRRVLVLGGGDGAAVYELLAYGQAIIEVTVVEHDEQIREASRKAFPPQAAALEDARVRWVVQDSQAFVAGLSAQTYDLILVDTGQAHPDVFWRQLGAALSPSGHLALVAGSPVFHAEALRQRFEQLRLQIPEWHVRPYWATLPTFPGGLWCYFVAGMPRDTRECQGHPMTKETHYYTPQLHEAAFALPMFVHRIFDL